jgi:hypothetical protein
MKKNWMTALIPLLAIGMALEVEATTARQLKRQSRQLNRTIQQLAIHLGPRKLNQLNAILSQAESALARPLRRYQRQHGPIIGPQPAPIRIGRGGGIPHGPSLPPPAAPTIIKAYTAECIIDDDLAPQQGGQNMGPVQGPNIQALLSECQSLAVQASNRFGIAKSLLMNLQPLHGLPPGALSATCHIDDDPQISLNQIVVGQVIGLSAQELLSDCSAIAANTFGNLGSATIDALNEGIPLPHGLWAAECWADDDPNFDMGQTAIGTIWGLNRSQLLDGCLAIAKNRFGTFGSAGLANVQVP